LPDFLPGRLCLRPAAVADYLALAPFHYRAPRPATWARILAVTYEPQHPCDSSRPRCVAIGVLSWPTAVSKPRRQAFGLAGRDYATQIAFANLHVRTISRIIVHPQFRGLGLARLLILRLCDACPTRFVEATAAMANAHPMFERAGMHRLPRGDSGPAYFWLDRAPDQPFPILPPPDGGARRRRRARTAAGGV
jgi:GNAT superfamily N-acetyltransferase